MNKNPVWILVIAFFASNLLLGLSNSNWSFVDENTYMSAALVTLNGQSCSMTNITIPTHTMCNYEHPPLVKVLEAVSLYAFGWAIPKSAYPHIITIQGNSPTGLLSIITYQNGLLGNISSSPVWFLSFRFFQLVMGALSLALIYVIARKISGNTRLALLSSLLLFLEPLYAFFSRTAYPDIPMIFFALCAYAVFFSSYHLGPVNEYWLTGVMLGLSVLSREAGIVFLFPLIVYHIVFGQTGSRRSRGREIATVAAAEVIVSAAGLQLYDTFAGTPFPTFLNHIIYMFNKLHLSPGSYGCTGSCSLGVGPFAWFTFFLPNLPSIGLSGNLILLWLIFLWIPLGIYSFWKSNRKQASAEDRLFVFATLLFGSTFLEDVLLYVDGQVTWIWYFLPVVPSLALGGAYLLTRKEVPNWTRITLFALLVVGYFSAYVIGPTIMKFD